MTPSIWGCLNRYVWVAGAGLGVLADSTVLACVYRWAPVRKPWSS